MRQTVNPTQKRAKKPVDLCKLVRTRRNLERAWQHVERRASASKDQDTQKALARVRENPGLELSRIGRALASGSFKFQKQKGYAKRRSNGKSARPIVVAPIVNRIVQRAILDVCQSETANIRTALGGLPAVIDQPTSVGGLPGRGVPEAIQRIRKAIDDGARWYVRSDLKNFFTRIPKPKIETYLSANVSDRPFVTLFMEALATELANEEAVREDLDLFPIGKIGVPQGSALSALCANIVLADFDTTLNGRGITTIRYLDDFVILGPTKRVVEKAWDIALKLLSDIGLDAHDPTAGTGKASKGEIASGFDFLSFHIDSTHAGPSAEAQRKLLESARTLIRQAKKIIQEAGNTPRRAEPMFLQNLTLLDRKIRGWGDAFSSTTLRVAFAQLDDQIDALINDFIRWFSRQSKTSNTKIRRRRLGMALLIDTEAK